MNKLKLFFTFFLALSLSGCQTTNELSIDKLSVDPHISENINNEFKRYNGYGFSAEEVGTKPDIYTTYYCMEALELLGVPLSDEEIISYLNYYENNKDYYFFNEHSNDAVVNIHYFTKIIDKIHYTTPLKDELYNYLKSIQYSEGDFALSKKEMTYELSHERHPELTLLSTKMSIESIIALDKEIPHLASINNWLKLRYNNFVSGKEKNSDGNIILLRDISKLINYDYSEYKQLISDIAEKCKENFINNDRIYLLDLENLLYDFQDTSILDDTDSVEKIKDFVMSLQDEYSGSFKLALNEPSTNILPTYYSLRIIKDLGLTLNNKDNLINWIRTFKAKDGGFILTGNLPADLSSTYYAYKLGLMENEDMKKYINTLSGDFENCSMESLYMYKTLVEDLSLDIDISKIDELANKKINESDISLLPYLFDIMYASKILNSKEITSSIIDDLHFNFDDYSAVNVNNQIFLALLYNDCSKKLTDEQVKYFEDIFNTLNNEYDKYSLDVYCTVYKILNENTEIDSTIKNQMQQILDMCQTEAKGVYRNGTGENSYKSLRSCYLSALVLSEI